MAQDQELNWGDEGFSGEELDLVQGIIDDALDGYTFFPEYVPGDDWILTPDIAPDWDALVRHCEATSDPVTQGDADFAFAQSVVDEGSDLRLYPAIWAGDPEGTVPVAVVISWRDKVVIGIG